jgi:cytochrome c551/c552
MAGVYLLLQLAVLVVTAQQRDFRAVLDRYCVTCHNQRAKTGGLALESIDVNNITAHADIWEKVLRKVRSGMMLPQGMPRPDAATSATLVDSLERSLDGAAAAKPNPGRPLLPTDDSSYGQCGCRAFQPRKQ